MQWTRRLILFCIGWGMTLGCDSAIDQGYSTTPVVFSFAPNLGLSQGRDQVSLFGENFLQVKRVDFGKVAAEILSISDNEIQVLTPVHQAGMVPVSIIDLAGQRYAVPELFDFRYSRLQFQLYHEIHLGSPSGLWGQTVAYGDFTGDGILDIANLLEVLQDGKITQEIQVAPGKAWPKSINNEFSHWNGLDVDLGFWPELKAADINQDGFDDLILFGKIEEADILLLTNLAGQGFSQITLGPHNLSMGRLLLADLDQDEFFDLVFIGSDWVVYWGSPQGINAEPLIITSEFPDMGFSSSSESDIEYCAIDRDPEASYIKAFHPTDNLWWLARIDKNRQVALEHYTLPFPENRFLALADVDNDGTTDRIFTNDEKHLVVELANEHETFFPPVPTYTECTALQSKYAGDLGRVRTGDINGDGMLDLFAFNINDDGCLLLGNGFGEFQSSNIPQNRWSISDIQLVDLNQDGAMDVLRFENSYYVNEMYRVRVLYGPALSFVPRLDFMPTSIYESISSFPLIADINQDGQMDLTGFIDSQKLFIAYGNLTTGLSLGFYHQFDTPLNTPRVAAGADFNNDEMVDFLILEQAGSGKEIMHIVWGNSDGWIPSEQDLTKWSYLGHGIWQETDQLWFVAYNDSNPEKASILLYDPTTMFFAPKYEFDIPSVDNPSECENFFNLNGDGLPDLMSSCTNDFIFLRFGQMDDGIFTLSDPAIEYGMPHNYWNKISSMDVDQDGDLDWIGTGFDDRFSIYFNDGRGDFSSVLSVPLKERHTFQGIIDLDGDGHQEFLIMRSDFVLQAISWWSIYRLEEPYVLHDFRKEGSFASYNISMGAIDDPFFPTDYRGGFFRHVDWTGDGLDDLMFLTDHDPWHEQWEGNLLLFSNVSW